MTVEQVQELLSELAEIVVAEIADPQERQKIIDRIATLTKTLDATVPEIPIDDPES